MPAALGAWLVVNVGVSLLASEIIVAVVEIAVTTGLSLAANALLGPNTPKPSDGQQIKKENVGSRYRHYGTVNFAGQLGFYEATSGTLHILLIQSQGRVGITHEHRINNYIVTLNSSGTVISSAFPESAGTDPDPDGDFDPNKYKQKIHIVTRDGTDDQTAIGELTSAFPAWTVNHRNRSCALAYIRADPVKSKDFSSVYDGGREPAYTRIMDGSFLYDPRKDSTAIIGYDEAGAPIYGSGSHRLSDEGTWEHADNGALVMADYWAHPDGFGSGYDSVNWVIVAEEADVADQSVTTVDDRTIPRWRLWGSYSLNDNDRRTVLSDMAKAIDAQYYQDADGLFCLRVGQWVEPTVHIDGDEGHILACSASLTGNPLDRVTDIKPVYTDARFDYSETEGATYSSGFEPVNVQRADVTWAPDHNQGERIAKRTLLSNLDRWKLQLKLNLFGLNLLTERNCYVSIPELSISLMAFEIQGLKIDFTDNSVTVMLSEVRSTDWDFDALTEEGDPPQIPGATFSSPPVPPATGVTLVATQINLGSSNGVGLRLSWDVPTPDTFTHEAQFSISGSDNWLPMSTNEDVYQAITGAVSSGLAYVGRVRPVTISGRPGAWLLSNVVTATASNPEVAPSPPSDTSASGGAGQAGLQWRNPPETNFGFVRVYRNTTNNFGTATALSGDVAGGSLAIMSVTDTPLTAGTYYWWFVSFNKAGTLASSPTASVSAVVT